MLKIDFLFVIWRLKEEKKKILIEKSLDIKEKFN